MLAKWRGDVEGLTGAFRGAASKVAAWDAQLRGARVELHHLDSSVAELQEGSERIEAELSAMEAHQDRTEALLGSVEAYIDQLMPEEPEGAAGGSSYVVGAQRARVEAYEAALELDGLLNALEGSLDDAEARVALEQKRQDNDPVRGGGVHGGGGRPSLRFIPLYPSSFLPVSHPHTSFLHLPPQLSQVRALLNEEVRNLTQIKVASAEVKAQARALADEAEAVASFAR